MTVDQINRMVEPIMDLPTLRVERKEHGEFYRVPISEYTARVAVYGLYAMTETVIATGRRTKVFTYRLHHFD